MKHSTYKTLYQAHLGVVDEKELIKSQNEETDPFFKNLLRAITVKGDFMIPWDLKPFTTEFRSESPRKRLDETFFAFVLRILACVKEESYIRTFRKPESHQAFTAWISVLRSVLVTSLPLLYNVQWTPTLMIKYLEPAITEMLGGDASALRKLMSDLGIKLAQDEPLYQAELAFGNLSFLRTWQFGSFVWRFLHWMAEALAVRGPEMSLYKNEWLNFIKGPFYRTLKCEVCMMHFQILLQNFGTRLIAENDKIHQLFFTMHNQTNAFKRESFKLLQLPDYTESQYQADSEFMRQAF